MKIVLLSYALYSLVSTTTHAQTYPTDNWTYSKTVEKDGWNSEKGKAFNQFLVDSTFITGSLIIYKGEIVFQYGDIEENSYVASCRKSILAMLLGKYVESGLINLDATLRELEINDVTTLLPTEKDAHIKRFNFS